MTSKLYFTEVKFYVVIILVSRKSEHLNIFFKNYLLKINKKPRNSRYASFRFFFLVEFKMNNCIET